MSEAPTEGRRRCVPGQGTGLVTQGTWRGRRATKGPEADVSPCEGSHNPSELILGVRGAGKGLTASWIQAGRGGCLSWRWPHRSDPSNFHVSLCWGRACPCHLGPLVPDTGLSLLGRDC